jgi:hypothetical protein
VDALGHEYGEWYVVTDANCTENGEKRHDCERCDHFETKVIEATGHSLVHHEAKAPTCTEIGWKAYDTCERCDYTTYMEIVATGHRYDSVVTNPTCTEKGYTTHTCHCGDSYIDSYVDALGHNYGEWYVVTDATCTENGEERHDCERCEHFETKVIEATGHSYSANVTAPTCTEKGYTTHTCHCGDSYIDSYVDATGHHHEMVDSKEPTATEDGYETWRCPDCGDEYTEVLPATGEPALWGDVNGDGSVDYMDAYLIMRYAVGYITEDALDLSVADVNGDEAVDYMDAYLIMRLAVGYIDQFPVEQMRAMEKNVVPTESDLKGRKKEKHNA